MKALAGCALAGALAVAAWGQDAAAKGVNFYSLDREAQLGREAAGNLSRTLPMVADGRLDAYLARLAAALGRNGDGRFSYSFTVYENRQPAAVGRVPLAMPVDAFQGPAREPVAVAGGPILVPLGLLADARSEAEFAFLLAHAMAHIALRHGTRLATRLELSRVGLTAAGSMGPDTFKQIDQSQQAELLTLARALEAAADAAAVAKMAAAGYDPQAAIGVLERLPAPDNAPRLEAARAAMGKLPALPYSADTGEFAAMKSLAAAVH
jgi:predicted Zn-dependent protease